MAFTSSSKLFTVFGNMKMEVGSFSGNNTDSGSTLKKLKRCFMFTATTLSGSATIGGASSFPCDADSVTVTCGADGTAGGFIAVGY